MPFSTAQLRSLALLPKITGSISILFSSLIVSNVIRNQQNHRRRTYHRIMCGISLADISASFWLALSTWPIPRSSNALWAVGTDTTCTLQGFFTQLGICSSFYNASLSIYYVLVIVWNWNDSQLRKVEWMLHLVPILFAVTTATAGVLLDIYGNATLWCFISAEHDPYRWAFFYGPLWVNIAIVTLSCGYIWAYVRKIERKANRWRLATSPPPPHPYPASNTTPNHLEEPSFSQPSNEASLPDDACISVVPSKPSRRSRLPSAGSASMHSSSHRRQSSSLHRTVSVANQCFLYAGAFYINWIALSVSTVLRRSWWRVFLFRLCIE